MNAALMLLKFVILLCCFISSWSAPWRPCTGTLPHLERHLLPLDLLHRVLPVVGSHQTRVRMVQSQGSRGLKLSGPPQSLRFPSSQIFTNCNFFPAEFSIVVTLKIPKLNPNKDEYIFTLLDGDSDELLVGLRLAHDKVHFLRRIDEKTERVTFRQVNMADGHWHTMVLALSGHYAVFTLDCGIPVELQLEKPFPEQLYIGGSTFFIGSRRRWSGLFSGLIRQLVLMPGSDASSHLCPSSDPTMSILSVPQILLHLPGKPPTNQLPLYPYEAELRVTQRVPPVCVSAVVGQVWFSIEKRSLFLCNGTTWITMLHEKEKLDYVEDHQDLFTDSETFDIEVFHLPSLGVFIATANRDSSQGSVIYRWTNGRFERFQNINTYDAQAWKFFTVGKKIFLVVANSRRIDGKKFELSVIYKWRMKKQRFVEYQKIQTHSARDWEAFRIQDDNFLAVANHREGEMNHNIDSVIYRWNRQTRKFEINQTISTSGAYDWEFFTIGPYHFLVVANTFNGKSTDISSTIYIWIGGKFQPFQYITTFGAIDWEMFQIDNRFFLAVANSQKLSDSSTVLYNINSTIYELNMTSQSFIKFQDIATSSALDWEFFTVGDDKFLVVANSYDGASYSLNSVIYRWQGYEGFVPVHRLNTHGCRDWEFFTSSDGSYLISSSARAPYSKVLKLKTYFQR
ncbi:thrombospondin-type laminin G domain and EAR repeat-containing protein [Ictalurus punctatus]|uniref:Thrombospondin-type laminin G domain and EAR repeat-containing protein n=1 Tax=Ictalurus punctatus TaxID=7998 RepID=A0A2D0R2U1_ICTPU|nr:thrombospondin-type laminin G domain and EAR repeat-containing protein [Ictalurus punctatus]